MYKLSAREDRERGRKPREESQLQLGNVVCCRRRKLEWKMRNAAISRGYQNRRRRIVSRVGRGAFLKTFSEGDARCPRIRRRYQDLPLRAERCRVDARGRAREGRERSEEERKYEWPYETLSITKSNTANVAPSSEK